MLSSHNNKASISHCIFECRIFLSIHVLQVIKLYAWELPFQRLIAGTRLQELHELKKVVLLQAVSMFSWTGSPLLVSELK